MATGIFSVQCDACWTPIATGILSVQCGVLDPNRDLMSSVWRAGPQPRYCEFSVACWTPTAILRVQCGVLDPNRDIACSVWRAGPQPRSCEFSVACRTSSIVSENLSERMTEDMSERMTEDMSERMTEDMSEEMSKQGVPGPVRSGCANCGPVRSGLLKGLPWSILCFDSFWTGFGCQRLKKFSNLADSNHINSTILIYWFGDLDSFWDRFWLPKIEKVIKFGWFKSFRFYNSDLLVWWLWFPFGQVLAAKDWKSDQIWLIQIISILQFWSTGLVTLIPFGQVFAAKDLKK